MARPVVEHTTEEGWDITFATNAKGVFLATDESAYMTGSELVIDGGITAR